MKWVRKNDTFILKRIEFCEIVEWLDLIDLMSPKPKGWNKERQKVYEIPNKLLYESAKAKLLKKVKK